MLNAASRLMLIAPHPDDEALACSIILQKAVRAGAAIHVVYITDGDNNPWPQRFLERKWRLSLTDRQRWGKLRRAEALAALHVLDVDLDDVQFLGLPDQGLTKLLLDGRDDVLAQIAGVINDWAPTDLLAPSIFDIHPDHSAVAVMLRLVFAEFISDAASISHWNYLVHGESAAFFASGTELPQSEVEAANKREAIRCHQTQTKLSKQRFLGYAARPECFVRVERDLAARGDGPIRFISRTAEMLLVDVCPRPTLFPGQKNTLFVSGRSVLGQMQSLKIPVPNHSSNLAIPLDLFSPAHDLFVKLHRRSLFFDKAGWVEIPPAVCPAPVAGATIPARSFSLAIR